MGGRQQAAGKATPRTGTPKVATLLSCTVAEVAKRLNVAAAPTGAQPPDADALERWREGVRGLPEPLRPLVASQLHYRALVQLVGELAWTGSADTDFHTLIGSIKQEEDVYRFWHWAVDAFPADNGLLFDVFDESCLEARLCRSYAPPPPSLLRGEGLVITPLRRAGSYWGPKLYDDGLTTDSATFRARFDTFTQGQLRHLDWGNVLVVGGAVTIPLAHTPDLSTWDQRHDARHYSHRLRTAEETQLCTEWGAGGIPLDAYYQRLFGPSDIDLYLYGLTPEQAKQKVSEIYHQVQSAVSQPVHYACSKAVVTLFAASNFRPIQIMTNIWKSKEEVLMSTDLNISAVGFDGKHVVALPRFVLAMRHKLNVLDSSIRFGEKMKWSRVFKYQARGLGCNLPIHIRLHGHGGLGTCAGQAWLERGVPQDGSLGQVYHLMAMAKLVLLKRHLGDLFPRPGSGDYFMWSSRWPLGVTKGGYGRSSPSKGSYAGDHKLLHSLSPEARARYESVWQRLGERAIALDGDPFDEGKNPNYDAYPVEQSMPLDEVRSALSDRGYHVHTPMAPGSEMTDLTTTPYADSSFQCFKMDAVVPGAQGEALPTCVPASPYLDVNTGLASVRYVVETHSMELPDFWEHTTRGDTPLDVGPFELSGSRWVLSFEALGGESRRELVFFRLRWLGFAHGEGTPSLEYRGDWCRANFLLSFNPLDQPTNEEECSPFTYDGSWVFGEGEESAYYEGMVFGCHLEQGVASPIDAQARQSRWGGSDSRAVYGPAGLRTAHVQLTVQVVDVAAPVLVW